MSRSLQINALHLVYEMQMALSAQEEMAHHGFALSDHFCDQKVMKRSALFDSVVQYNWQSLLGPLQTLYVGLGFHRARWCVFASSEPLFSCLNNKDQDRVLYLTIMCSKITPTVPIQDSVEEFGLGLPIIMRVHNFVQGSCLHARGATRRLTRLRPSVNAA